MMFRVSTVFIHLIFPQSAPQADPPQQEDSGSVGKPTSTCLMSESSDEHDSLSLLLLPPESALGQELEPWDDKGRGKEPEPTPLERVLGVVGDGASGELQAAALDDCDGVAPDDPGPADGSRDVLPPSGGGKPPAPVGGRRGRDRGQQPVVRARGSAGQRRSARL